MRGHAQFATKLPGQGVAIHSRIPGHLVHADVGGHVGVYERLRPAQA